MDIGSKDQLNFFSKYPMLGVMIVSLVFNAIQYKVHNDSQDKTIQILQNSSQDYRTNTILSNQIKDEAKRLYEHQIELEREQKKIDHETR